MADDGKGMKGFAAWGVDGGCQGINVVLDGMASPVRFWVSRSLLWFEFATVKGGGPYCVNLVVLMTRTACVLESLDEICSV